MIRFIPKFQGIKIKIPIELITKTTYLKYYIDYIRALEIHLKVNLHLAIMVSDDTHDLTVEYLS